MISFTTVKYMLAESCAVQEHLLTASVYDSKPGFSPLSLLLLLVVSVCRTSEIKQLGIEFCIQICRPALQCIGKIFYLLSQILRKHQITTMFCYLCFRPAFNSEAIFFFHGTNQGSLYCSGTKFYQGMSQF